VLNNIPLFECIVVYLFIQDCMIFFWIPVLEILNKTTINIHAQVFVNINILNSFVETPRRIIAGLHAKTMFNFIRN
jgi:hypothetical protein